LYGAGDEKIGEIIGKGAASGRKLKKQFLDRTPALRKLREAVQQTVKDRGYLVGLDGRHLRIRSAHAALNTLLQSAGALVMKKALVILDHDLQEAGLIPGIDYEFLANIHDEYQIAVLENHAQFVGETAVKAIKKAGDYFEFRCPLDGEFKIGNNWAECH
jgi:DNA polymerase I-like protein with 3'-5' exonuclease and polymerase domains